MLRYKNIQKEFINFIIYKPDFNFYNFLFNILKLSIFNNEKFSNKYYLLITSRLNYVKLTKIK